ncbi:MAG: hypothetical protein WBG50_27620 [Desulfomonilaceae bacterium]
MTTSATSRILNAKEAVDSIRGTLSNAELMEKFKISPQGLADLIKQLFEKKLISEDDLSRRGIRFKIVKKQSPPQTIPSPPQIIKPSPREPTEDTEEFLDTITLTELLSFVPPGEKPDEGKDEPTEIPLPEEAAEELNEKKSKFSITGFFKRGK